MITRLTKTWMVFGLGLFAALVTFNNLTDYGANFTFVQHVLAMDTTFADNQAMYRAITTPWLWHLAYAAIILTEAATAGCFLYGAYRLWSARNAAAAEFERAKEPVVLGTALAFALWFVGFMVIGGEWFLMWQSSEWNGQEAAFRFYMTALAVLIFVKMPERA
jgi:predicted small integral membrane protein